MTTPHGFIERLAVLAQSGRPFVSVTMVDAVGSTPQDAGSKMLVTAEGLDFGTVGGGHVEHQAIEHARRMLGTAADASCHQLITWNLQHDLGMSCGGVVRLYFETYNHRIWKIAVFGAGHVANALVRTLLTVDCRVTCIDPRAEWIARLPASPKLRTMCVEHPSDLVADLDEASFVVLMTMGHRTDRPILERILRARQRYPFVGVIGSQTKRQALERELIDAGVDQDRARQFVCPVGLKLGGNQPGEIAISIAAQLLQCRDRMLSNRAGCS